MKNRSKLLAGFLVPSIIGIMLFMIPVKFGEHGFFDPEGSTTIVVKVIADTLQNAIGYSNIAFLCVLILTVSALMSVFSQFKPRFIMDHPILKECFDYPPT